VESVLKDSGVNPRKLDQRFDLGSTEVIKPFVIAGLGAFPVLSVRQFDSQRVIHGERPPLKETA
jgi:hypothetical protein